MGPYSRELVWILSLTVMAFQLTPSFAKCLKDLPDVSPKRYLYVEGQTLSIRLETSQRITHRLSTHIFKIFLEEILGYPEVQIIERSDNFNISQVFNRLSVPPTGEIRPVPDSMVNLEVWVPTLLNLMNWIKFRPVKDCGSVAPQGRFGWFVPQQLLQDIPNIDHWRVFLEIETAKLFDITEDLMEYLNNSTISEVTKKPFCNETFCENGFYIPEWCEIEPCALLLAGYADSTKFVVDHIKELHLLVKVVWVGPNLRDVVEMVVNTYVENGSNSSVVVLSSTLSNELFSENHSDFVSISFPPCEIIGTTQSVGCKYESQRLVKLAWAKLEKGAQPAYQAILKYSFSQENYKKLLYIFDQESQTKSIEDIACDWMAKNKNTWKSWIPRTEEKKLAIFGIFPLSGSGYTAKGVAKAAIMAFEAVNQNTSILKDYKLELLLNDGQCKAEVVMKTYIDYILFKDYSRLVGVLGPACSETVEPLAGVTKHFKTVVISYSAEGSSFSDRDKYPYFFRTIGENKQYKDAYLQLFKQMGWKRVAALTEDGQKYTEYISHMQDQLQKEGIKFVENRKFPPNKEKVEMKQYLELMKSKNARIIIADVYETAVRAAMCEAHHLQMTAKHGYVWFLPLWLSKDWFDTDEYNSNKGESTRCSTVEMMQAINGHLALTHAYYADDDVIMQENITVAEWRKKYKANSSSVGESNYAGFAYDAVWTFAYALDKLSKEDQSYLSNIHSENATKRYVEILGKTEFQGVSGEIFFPGGGPSRVTVINVVQWYNNATRIVGSFKPNVSREKGDLLGGELVLNRSALVWLSEGGQVPDDGAPAPVRCLLQWLADGLGVECEMAIILANVVGALLLVAALIVAFLVVKRRYDRKVQETQRYMETLQMDLFTQTNVTNLDKWEIARDRVVINRKLGEGAFGTVYGGEAYCGKKWIGVAVKTLKVGSTTEEKLDFLSEAEVMKRFGHQNIVKLEGVCTKNEPVYTIMELMLYGDLKNFLLGRRHLVNDASEKSDEICNKRLTSMALDVARALNYLAELKYVHRDVASRNCLVNADRVVKLGDFGMTRLIYESDYYKFNRKGMLPVRWMAPESLGLGIFTPYSDVWSYGVLLYEIITFGSFPFQGLSNNEVLEYVKQGNTLTLPQQIHPQLMKLIRSCWNYEYKKRPQASDIVEFLTNNPYLISPCLDVPLASVQMEDTGQLEIQLPEKIRKCSVSIAGGGKSTIRDRSLSSTDSMAAPRELARTDSGTGSVNEGGCGQCVREPLLGTSRSTTSLAMGLTKYIGREHRDKSDECDEYCTHDPSPQAVSIL